MNPIDPTLEAQEPAPTIEQLIARYGRPLQHQVMQWTTDRHLAEDIVQETWLRAWRHLDRMTDRYGSVYAWLARVARNLLIDRVRARRVRPEEVELDDATDEDVHVLRDDHARALDGVLVRQVLASAPPALRELLVEVYLRDRPLAEVAVDAGIPLGTLKSRLYGGIHSLRTTMPDLAA
ncbi:MAG: sigma-70 family RNA polymerase sigma factor [Nocardioides sp.]